MAIISLTHENGDISLISATLLLTKSTQFLKVCITILGVKLVFTSDLGSPLSYMDIISSSEIKLTFF